MKQIDKILNTIKTIEKTYSDRISKLREKRSTEAKFKIGKMKSMASRGKDITKAGERLIKFAERYDNNENHIYEMRDKRINALMEKRALLLKEEEKRERKKQDKKEHQQLIKDENQKLIESESSRWRGKKKRIQNQRNKLIINLDRLKKKQAKIIRTAHGGKAVDYFIENSAPVDPLTFLNMCKREVFRVMIPKHVPSKSNFKLECIFAKKNTKEEQQKIISTPAIAILPGSNFRKEWEFIVDDLLKKIHNFMIEKSGWRLKRIIGFHIATNKYNPIKAGTYIEIPQFLAAKKALINIQNDDQECFKWAITRSLYKHTTFKNNPGKVSNELKEQSKNLNWKDIEFPVERKHFSIFEKNNKDIGLMIYEFAGKKILPIHITQKEACEKAYILLYKTHYLTISNLSRLLSSQVSKNKKALILCERCTTPVTSIKALEIHKQFCGNHDYVKLNFPKPGSTVKFQNYRRKQKNFLTIYADFECYMKKEEIQKGDKTTLINKHVSYAWGIYTKRLDGKNEYFDYVGENCEEKFMEKLREITQNFYNEFKFRKPLIVDQIRESDKCWICEKELKNGVNDHCHFTGNFRGKAHEKCNLLLKRNLDFIPVFLHNLGGYDERLFIRKLGEKTKIRAKNDETFISFSEKLKVDEYEDKKGNLKEKYIDIRFVDSFKFLKTGLDNLSKNLEEKDFIETNKHFTERSKGIFPYEYIDSLEKLKETELPPHEKFYSILDGTNITEEEYRSAKEYWEKYGCSNLEDYTRIYMKLDILLLTDIFENFKKTCIKHYGLDPSWYYTVPGFAWDCCLKFTEQELELIDEENSEMYYFIEAGIRGGISCITKRFGKANNPYMKNYNPKEKTKYILDLDANNLYGWAMCEKLPVGKFKWMTEKELENWESDEWGCVLEVDMDYPDYLHNLHNDLPLAPERIDGKLIPNLNSKKNYIIHREKLKTCLELGLKLTKIHKGVRFEEKAWLKPYIEFNTEKRAKSKTAFEKDFFKLMNNSVFGKTMENLRNRVNVHLSNNKDFEEYVRKVNFERRMILDENKSIIHLRKNQINANKPMYVGMAILDISKTLMYKFHYNEILGKQFPNAELLFTDTDSLCYLIETEDVYKTMAENVDKWYDTSDYPSDFKTLDGKQFPSGKNKKKIGFMKDEEAGKQITKFVGLRSKCYSYKTEKKETKKAKGVKKNIIKNKLTIDHYEKCLFEKKSMEVEIPAIRSYGHNMYTQINSKKALDYTDTKRKILENNIDTRAWGHYLDK